MGLHSELRPVRIPLQTKKTKRCGLCKHILIKPEQKAQSVRFKIKLVAANYLPSLSVSLPHQRPPAGVLRAGAAPPAPAAGLQAGRTYPFRIGFTNPLYDPIQVRLSVQRAAPTMGGQGGADEKRRPPFAVSIPTQAFGVAAFAEAWEYDDDEEMEDASGGGEDPTMDGRGAKTVGVLERKANVTVVGGEVVLGKAARGDVKVWSDSFICKGMKLRYQYSLRCW
jgi:dynactin-4